MIMRMTMIMNGFMTKDKDENEDDDQGNDVHEKGDDDNCDDMDEFTITASQEDKQGINPTLQLHQQLQNSVKTTLKALT
eukprot:2126972-Ditylum_brightwellii.AAC.1